jgi:hypothetical protein
MDSEIKLGYTILFNLSMKLMGILMNYQKLLRSIATTLKPKEPLNEISK